MHPATALMDEGGTTGLGRPIRVGLVVRWPTGGIRTHLKYLYSYLSPDKYQPVLIAPGGPETDFLLDNLSRFRPECYLAAGGGSADFANAVWRAMRRGRIDVVHSHGFTSAGIAAFPAKAYGVPHLATIHDVITDQLSQRLGRSRLWALRLAVQQATLVQAVGEDAADNLRTRLLSNRFARSRLRVVRNGVDLVQYSGVVPMDLRAKLGIDKSTFLVGFLGRFMAQKGFRVLVDAVEILRAEGRSRPVHVLAVGEGGFIREDRAEVEARGLKSFFTFWEPVENPAPLMAGLDCLAMPSMWEAFSVLACEVMCLGTPLIASDCIGLREAVQETPTRVVPAGDAQALAAAIRAEMKDSSREAAREFAAEARGRFDACQSARGVEALLDEVLRERWEGAS